MGHPSYYFIKFMLAQNWGEEELFTHQSLNTSLKGMGLVGLLEPQYEHVMGTFKPPKGFKFNTDRHRPTQDFMKKEGITALWLPKKDDKRVLDELLNGSSLIQQDLHLLLMGNLPHDVITYKLNTKWKLRPKITERMVDTYAHYFWDIHGASFEEWGEVLAGKSYRDAFLAALHCGEQQALYRAGFSPKIEGGRALKELYRQAFFRMEALRHQPDTKSTVSSFSILASKMMNAHELLFAEGSGLQERLKQFRMIMMKHKDPDIKAIDTLIDKLEDKGSYSGDGSADDTIPEGDLQ